MIFDNDFIMKIISHCIGNSVFMVTAAIHLEKIAALQRKNVGFPLLRDSQGS
jgi:hypothetical protein